MALLQICVDKQCLRSLPGGHRRQHPQRPQDVPSRRASRFRRCRNRRRHGRLRRGHNIELSKTVELQAMVPFVIRGKWHNVRSLETFRQDLLGVNVENKGTSVRVKNQDRPRQSDEQIKYACTNAYVSYKISEILQKKHDLHFTQSPRRASG